MFCYTATAREYRPILVTFNQIQHLLQLCQLFEILPVLNYSAVYAASLAINRCSFISFPYSIFMVQSCKELRGKLTQRLFQHTECAATSLSQFTVTILNAKEKDNFMFRRSKFLKRVSTTIEIMQWFSSAMRTTPQSWDFSPVCWQIKHYA